MRLIYTLLMLPILVLPVQAQELPADRSAQYSPRAPEGLFDVIVFVDGEAFLYVRDKNLSYLLVNGAAPRGSGSNYTQPIPQAVFGTFNMTKVAGRGTVTLVEEPSVRNNYTAILRVTDNKPGAELYHIQLNWTWNPANPSRPPGGRYSAPVESRRNDPSDYNRRSDGEFEFRGRIDDVTVLHIRSDQVRSEILSGRSLGEPRFRFSQPLPANRLREFELLEASGRGQIELVEKPWEGNRYTAVVRITDRQSGAGDYSFRLQWKK